MQAGDFVYIDYIGRIKDSREVFDTTKEDIAKKEGMYNPNFKYRPVPVIVDGGFTLKGLDDALKEMKVGEEKTVEIPPEKAFGERKTDFIRLIPLSVFKEQDVNPTPGSFVNINRLNGRVVSIDGGRVKVDFNHPLAGKKLEYEIEIKNEIKDSPEKVKAIVNHFTAIDVDDIDVNIANKECEIKLKKRTDLVGAVKENIANTIMKWLKEIGKVKFVEEYQSK